jgi:hypothetical protein
MAFFLSVLYLLIYFLTPALLFGPLAQIHIEVVLAVLIALISVPQMMRSFVFKTPQTLALAGLSVAVFLSVLIGVGWPGGAVSALLQYIPSMFAFLLLGLHCNSRNKLRVLVLMLLFVCLFVIANGMRDLQYANSNVLPTGSIIPGDADANFARLEIEHPYVIHMSDDDKKVFYRVRGLGQINDPNDFGQILVCEIPLLFIFWRPKKLLRNLAFVIVPAGVLGYGIYLTHSRGALVALLVVILVAARRRIGTLPAGIIAAALFAGAMALHFTGGRAISASAGSGREDLWGESLQILKSHPIFGIGLDELPGYIGHTAHNSIIVCATELGLLGLYFWTLFLYPTMRSALLIASPGKVSEAHEPKTGEDMLSPHTWRGAPLQKPEINRLGFCILLSLTGFLAAGWFLSRALVLTFFLLGGMAEVVYENAQQRGMTAPRPALARALFYSFGLMFGLLMAVYLILRVLNLSR